jgi:hypothetical protein
MYSQKGFYLHPTIESKKWFTNRNNSFSVTTPQGIVLNVKSMNLSTLYGADIGLLIGYRTKNYFFETGISQDRVQQGFSTINPYTVNNLEYITITGSSSIFGNMNFTKFPFRMGVKLFGADTMYAERKLRWQGFLYGGFDYLFTRGVAESAWGDEFIVDTAGHSIGIYAVDELDLKHRHALFANMGFMIKTYTKKGRTFLNISIDYKQTLQPNNILDITKVVIQNYDGHTYSSALKTRGSCFTLTLSTDIYLKRKRKQYAIQ